MRLKNEEDLVRPRVMGVERRVILRKRSTRFSKELALALTKHLRRALMDSVLNSLSSTWAVGACERKSRVYENRGRGGKGRGKHIP